MIPFVPDPRAIELGLPDHASVAARAGDDRPAARRISHRLAYRKEALVEKRSQGVAGDGIQPPSAGEPFGPAINVSAIPSPSRSAAG